MNRMIRMNNYISIKDLEVFANHGVLRLKSSLVRNSFFLPKYIQIFAGLSEQMIFPFLLITAKYVKKLLNSIRIIVSDLLKQQQIRPLLCS